VRNVFTIAGKELRSYFASPVAYVLLAAYLALGGYFFYALLTAFNQTLQIYSMMRNPEMLSRFNLNQMVVIPLLHNMSVLLIFIVPAISMRMFPEEKRAGTYELLLTSPVRVGEIVLGKFLGGLVLVPEACSSLVDAPAMRRLLQRRLYERTGYTGPDGAVPPPSPLAPDGWPELGGLTPVAEDRIIAKLQRFARERPGYYPSRRGPGQ